MINPLDNLLEPEQWLQDFFDNAHDLIQIVHVDARIMFVNQAWTKLLQYRPDEIIGKQIYDFVDSADRNRYKQYRDDIIARKVAGMPAIFNLTGRSGNKITVEGLLSVKAEGGQPKYTFGIFRDITERIRQENNLRQLNEELKENARQLQELLKFAPDAVIAIDEESRIKFWNPKAEEIFGWSAEEVVNRTLSSTIIPPQHRAAHEAGMKRYLTTGEIRVLNRTIEITALNKKGEEFYISLTISRTSPHANTAFIAFARDITDYKKAQLEIEKKTVQLEQSNQSLEAFAYAASHDLKQPIRKVQIFAERLEKKLSLTLDSEEKFYFERISTATKKMRALIDDLLNFSSISVDKDFSDDVDLNQVLKEVLDDHEVDIGDNDIIVTADALPVIKGDRRQLQQLFQNLVGNAIKYRNPDIRPSIHIGGKMISGNEAAGQFSSAMPNISYYLIYVRDNGIGFDQKYAERIFKVFTRLHKSDKYQGSGIGLSIVQKVIENHKGDIKAESEAGKGAIFKMIFPVTLI